MSPKTVTGLHLAYRDDIGDLVTRRPVPGPRIAQVDPFLFLNHHGPQTYRPGNSGLPFGPHPHRGFETVTFILDGELMHRDSAGFESVIRAGGVQWMTAGSGLVHAELSPDAFKRAGGPMEILQLWVNLPSRLKMSPPRYQGVQGDSIPVVEASPGARLHLVSGRWRHVEGAIESITDVFMSVLNMSPGATLDINGLKARNVFLYVVCGEAEVNGRNVPSHNLAELDVEGDTVVIRAQAESVLLFGHAEPIGEPVVSYGPFVMNTEDEIRTAIRDYQAGRMGRIEA